MSFNIPNLPAASFPAQATVSSQDFQIIADSARGNGVVTGPGECLVTQRAAGANMSCDVAAGTIVFEGGTALVTAGNLSVSAAHATLARIDVISVTSAGVKVLTAGTPAASPLPPAIPAAGGVNNVALAFVYIPAADTAITTTQITDKRMFVNTPGGASIPNDSVTYAKMQNISAASRLLGRGSAAGAGDPQELTLGTNLSMSGTVLNATGGTGSTPTGTGFTHITAGVEDAAAKLVDTADVTNDAVTYAKLQNVSAASKLLGRGDSGAGDPQELTLGAGLTMTGTTLSAPSGGGGTVTTSGTPASGNLTQFSGTTAITNGNLSGDVTTAGTLAATIAAGAVTYAKMQDVSAASRLLGRGSAGGAGDPQEITLGTNLSLSGTVLNATGGGGSTPTGTGFTHITAGAQDAAAKLVDTADINNAQVSYAKLQNVSAASRLLGRGSAGGAGSAEELTLGTNLSLSGTTLNASGSGGSVTVRKNTGADVGTRPRLNLIEGSNVTLTVADDAGGNEVDITIAAAASGASDTVVILGSDVVHTTNSQTLEDITGLSFSTTGGANELWRVEYWLIMDANSIAGSNAKHKIGWAVSGAQTGLWGSNPETGQTSSGALYSGTFAQTLIYGSVSNVTGRMLLHLRVLARANGASGAIMPRFAQLNTGAGAILTVKADSHYIARKIRS